MGHAPPSTILIVDDDSDMRLYCARALESEGYQTVLSSNASGALDVLRRQSVSLLLTDFQLGPAALRLAGGLKPAPALTGVGLMELTQASYPNLPVVFISAYGDQLASTRGFDPGQRPLLRKPFQAESLRRVVRDALQEAAFPAVQATAPAPVLKPRAHPRFQVRHEAVFHGRIDGTGVVTNISLGGCHIQSSCMARPDTYLTLVLTLPDTPQPLKVNVAVVRWTRPGVLGLEFRYLEAPVHERLAQYLCTLSQTNRPM